MEKEYLDYAYNFVEREKLADGTFITGVVKDQEVILSPIEFLRSLLHRQELPKYLYVPNFDRLLVNYANDEKVLRLLISAFNRYAPLAERTLPLVVFPVERIVQGTITTIEIQVDRKTFDLKRIFNERIEDRDPYWKKGYYKIS